MKRNEIIEILSKIHLDDSIDDVLIKEIQAIKEECIKNKNQKQAKIFWIYQRIIEVHILYRQAFTSIKKKNYYEGWCKLEEVEIVFKQLKKHFSYKDNIYYLSHIEKAVRNLQALFPYKLFISPELLYKRKKCSVCEQTISVRNSCNHTVGEIYNGEICCRIVTEVELLGISIVGNPGHKYSVLFPNNEDHYSYDTLNYLFKGLKSPYQGWDLEIIIKTLTLEDYGKINRNELCPCKSGKKFKKCCIVRIGEKYPHYKIILAHTPSQLGL